VGNAIEPSRRRRTTAFEEVRLAELSPKDVCACSSRFPKDTGFETTQALRQVLNRAVSWGLINYNPAKRGVPNPVRRSKEKRPVRIVAATEAVARQLGPTYGRWSCSPRPQGFGPPSCSRSSSATFAVSRFMGSSIAMIDYHYGHLARDSREHAISLLDALAFERAVDAGWTPPATLANPLSKPRRRRSRKPVDVRWTSRRKIVASPANRGELISRNFSKPSDGLEPSAPSLPVPLVAPAWAP